MTFQTPLSSEKHVYDRATKIKLVKQAFTNINETRIHRNELIVFCPKHFHHKPKLEINVENNIFHCWVCNYSGLVPRLLKEVSRIDLAALYMPLMGLHKAESESASEGILVPPKGTYGLSLSNEQVCKIQHKINITKSDIIKGGIGISEELPYKDRIIFPSFNKNGKLNYFLTRSFVEDKYKYITCKLSPKSIIFNELYVNWNKPLILTESVKTHFKMIDYCNFVPILGSTIHQDSKLLSEMILNGTKEVILMFDRDAEERQFAAAKMMINFGIDVKMVTDLMGAQQPDNLDVDQILQAVKNSRPVLSTQDIVKLKIAKKAGK